MLNSTDIEKLREIFQKVDTDNSGCIEIKELQSAVESANFEMTAKELKKIIEEIDYDGNSMINYTEFLAATISVH